MTGDQRVLKHKYHYHAMFAEIGSPTEGPTLPPPGGGWKRGLIHPPPLAVQSSPSPIQWQPPRVARVMAPCACRSPIVLAGTPI